MHAEQDVVIYGGGMAGAILAKQLSKDLKVTLVDPRDFFEVPMAVSRNLVEPAFAEFSTFPFAQALPKVSLVQGSLIKWTHSGGIIKTVQGETKQIVSRVNVLATGSQFADPMLRPTTGTRQERLAFFQRNAILIEQAKRILIIGGGPVGVEVAGEISSHYPHIQITLIESGSRILRGTTVAAADHAAKTLTQRNVEILTEDRLLKLKESVSVKLTRGGSAITEKGRHIDYDILMKCSGAEPNTSYMKAEFPDVLDINARICVTPSLRVVGEHSVFALGDINNVEENKMAWHVATQVICAEKNVRSVLSGHLNESDLVAYQPKTGNPSMAITLGPDAGILQLQRFGLITNSWLNRRIKARHMLVPKYRKILGV